jgi:hypothetical protein
LRKLFGPSLGASNKGFRVASKDGAARPPRINLMLSAQLCREGAGAPTIHRVVNLSQTGACIARPRDLRSGDRVEIAIGQAEPVVAQVVRIDGDQAGLRFEQPIDLDAARQRRSSDFVPRIGAGWLAERQRVFR